jgi:hypothetical protein
MLYQKLGQRLPECRLGSSRQGLSFDKETIDWKAHTDSSMDTFSHPALGTGHNPTQSDRQTVDRSVLQNYDGAGNRSQPIPEACFWITLQV